MKSRTLENKVCLIAGTTVLACFGASFWSRGAKIVAVGRTRENAEALGSDLTREGTETLLSQRIFQNPVLVIVSLPPRWNILAGSMCSFMLPESVDANLEMGLLRTALMKDGHCHGHQSAAMMQMNRACLKHWLETKQCGVILNMASVLGFSFVPEHFSNGRLRLGQGGDHCHVATFRRYLCEGWHPH